jgi:hypothetical protein
MSDAQTRYPVEVWEKVRALAEADVPFSQIEKMPGMPTKQAISLKAAKEDWALDINPGDENALDAVFKPLLRHQLGRDSQEARQKVLDVLAAGGSFELAAALIGMTSESVRRWRKEDEEFEMMCRTANGTGLIKPTRTLMRATDNDWQAAKYVLERNPLTRAAYAGPSGTLPGNTTFNVLGQVSVGITRQDDAA